MMELYLDAGTTWSKLIAVNVDDSFLQEFEPYKCLSKNEKTYFIVPSKIIRKCHFNVTKSTGHMVSGLVKEKNTHLNEIIALTNGAKEYLKDNAIILDLGSRDSKWIEFKSSKFRDLDWNSSCASATGATIEMLLKFYDVDPSELIAVKEKYDITCGIFGLEKIMDDISNGINSKIAIAKFIHGIAYNAWMFTKQPKELFLSGGFCQNKCFLDSLSNYTKVVPLGRFMLCEGLI